MSRFAELIQEVEQAAPMVTTTVPGRVLLVDGDMLAYHCAGNADTLAGEARSNLLDKVQSAVHASGAEYAKILITARSSHKGHRYAVARAKPYQGRRDHGEKPKHWEYLRTLMESGQIGPHKVHATPVAEADDMLAYASVVNKDPVIYSQDKDMRMLSGWHLDWIDHTLVYVPRYRTPAVGDSWDPNDGFRVVSGNKVYGRAWFWQQMLHGDTVDNIPGLPFYTDGSLLKSGPKKGQLKQTPVGDKAEILQTMAANHTDMGSLICAQSLYMSCYGKGWCVNLLEQAILLWLRTDAESDPFNVTAPGNPLESLVTHADYPAARTEIEMRIQEATAYAEVEDDGGSDDAGLDAGAAEEQVRPVPAPPAPTEGCPGSRPLDGPDSGGPAQRVQLPVGESGEQPQEVRGAQPGGVPAWVRRLLAAPCNGPDRSTAPNLPHGR